MNMRPAADIAFDIMNFKREMKNVPHQTRVLIFNGPPRCGKDTVTRYLVSHFSQYVVDLKMAYCLKKAAHSILGMHQIDVEHYNDTKDISMNEFYGATPHKFYIDLAENFIKKRFGPEAFGNAWLKRYWDEQHNLKLAIVSDCDFSQELMPLIKIFGSKSMVLIRIHRQGFDFRKDSRGYIPDGFLPRTFDFENPEGSPMKFISKVVYFLEQEQIFAGFEDPRRYS